MNISLALSLVAFVFYQKINIYNYPFFFAPAQQQKPSCVLLLTMSPSRSPNSDEDAGPSKKKIKVEEASTEPPTSKQSNLHQFFASSKLSSPKSSQPNNGGDRSKENKGNDNSTTADADAKHDSEALDKKSLNNNPKENNEESIPDPIIPKEVTSQSNARWKVVENCMLVRTIPKEEPRSKAAAFDVDGTIFNWRIPGWPSRFEHYELWSANVITKLQKLHDKEGYKLVLISNQGAIRGAFNGKKVRLVMVTCLRFSFISIDCLTFPLIS